MKAGRVEPVKLVASVFSRDAALIESVLGELEKRFGETDLVSDPLELDSTDYYEAEFGKGLVRRVASFASLIDPGELPGIKLETNALEETWSGEGGRRRVNIDPGYVTLERLILASCKNFTHRVHLARAVYADLTLVFRAHGFLPLEWTFPDYASGTMRELFKTIRSLYAEQIGRGS